MAAPAYDHDPTIDQVLDAHDHFDPPEGFRAEVIGGNIVLSPTPAGNHNYVYAMLHTQLIGLAPKNMAVTNTTTVSLPATEERYVPDVIVLPKSVLRSEEWVFQADDIELVAEIVSPSSRRIDRVIKLCGYAASGVSGYLLIDPLERTVTLFTEPVGESYQGIHRVPFGEKLALPEPFDGVIDTAEFA